MSFDENPERVKLSTIWFACSWVVAMAYTDLWLIIINVFVVSFLVGGQSSKFSLRL